MKFMVVLPLVLCLVRADSSDKQDVKTKMTSSTHNTIAPVKNHEVYYQNMLKYHQPQQQQQQLIHQQQHYQKPQYVPVQLIPRPYYQVQPHHHPQAMIIIAQPALVPQSLFYGAQQQAAASPTQQLLNYFHSNPQAKYQLLHGTTTQQLQQVPHHVQQVQPTYAHHQVVAAPSYGNYIFAMPPHYHQPGLVAQAAATVPVHAVPHTAAIAAQYQVQPQYQIQPQLQTVLAQHQVAQHQLAQQQQQQQQHQVAAAQHQVAQQQQQQQQQPAQHHQHQPQQLSSIAHLAQLAAQQFHSASGPAQKSSAPSAIVTGFEHFSPEQQAQIKAQLSNHLGANYHAVTANSNGNQYSAKYQAAGDEQQVDQEEEFVPSPQVKTVMDGGVGAGGSALGGDILKTRYTTKGIRM